MPRGWRESHRPDTGDSERGRPKLPLWNRKSCGNESSPPAVSSPRNYFEQKQSENETTDRGGNAKSPTYLDANLTVPSNTTETLVSESISTYSLYSPVNLQPETRPTQHSLDGVSVYPSHVSDSSANTPNKATSPSSAKPLSLLPFLSGVPSNVGMAGSVALTSSKPQWMQLLNKQDAGQKQQDLSSGW